MYSSQFHVLPCTFTDREASHCGQTEGTLKVKDKALLQYVGITVVKALGYWASQKVRIKVRLPEFNAHNTKLPLLVP